MKSAIDSNNMRGTAMNMRDSGRAWSVTAALLVLFCSGNGAKGQTQPPAQSIPYAQNFGTATFGTMPTGWALWANSGSANQSQTLAEAINPAADTTVTNAVFAAQTSGGAYGDLQSGNARLVVLVSSNATNGAVVPVLSLNTTGQSNLTLTYSMTVARVAASVSANAVTQYRIGNSGSWTTISGTNNPYSVTSSSTAGTISNISLPLPSACNNQAVVQIRWAVWRGTESGTGGAFALDNVSVSAGLSDANVAGSTVDAILTTANEYGPTNSYRFTGGGTSFASVLGGGTLYVNSDAANLYLAYQLGGTLNDSVALLIDTGSANPSSYPNITSGGDERAISRMFNNGATLPIGFRASYAVIFAGTNQNPGNRFYSITSSAINSAALGSSSGTGTATTNIREVSIPLSTLGISSGATIRLLASISNPSGTPAFMGSETIPTNPLFNAATQPGTSGGTFTNFGSFTTFACQPVTVGTQPTPSSQSVCQSASVTYTVAGSGGDGSFTYLWKQSTDNFASNNVDASGTNTNASYSPSTASAGTMYYRCVVSSSCGSPSSATSNTVTLTVTNPPSAALAVSAAAASVCSGTGTNVNVALSESGVSYQLRNGSSPVGSPVTGTGGTISLPTGNLTSATTFNVLATLSGCTAVQLTQTATVNVDASPNTPTGTASYSATTGSALAISATVGVGETVDWFTGSCGGTQVATGQTSLSIASVSQGTTTYYARARNTTTGCNSAACLTVTVVGTSQVVISQIYGGGGNTGATYQNDYVELLNRGTTSVSVAGWTVQYASSTGSFDAASATLTANLSGSIGPGGYYLVQLASAGAVGALLPAFDATANVNMSATNGKVALASNNTTVTGPTASNVVDFVGYGSANAFEGTAAVAALSNTTAGFRINNGCQDNNQNSTDFATGTPRPRNSASPVCACAGGLSESITDAGGAVGGVTGGTLASGEYGPTSGNYAAGTYNFGGDGSSFSGMLGYYPNTSATNTNVLIPRLYFKSDGTGVNIAYRAGAAITGNNTTVLLLDTQPGGSTSSPSFTDNADPGRASASRMLRSGRPATFGVDYVLIFYAGASGSSSTLFSFNGSALTPVSGMTQGGTVTTAGNAVEVRIPFTSINNFIPGGNIDFIASLSNGDTSGPTMSDETIPVSPALSGAGNQGTGSGGTFTNYNRFSTVPCPTPSAGLSVSAADVSVCSGGSTSITVALSETGVSYQLRTGITPIGTAQNGNGGTLTFSTGALTGDTTFNVFATRTSCGVGVQLNTTVTVTVNPLPVAPTSATANPASYCENAAPPSITLTAVGGSGTTARWFDDACGGHALGTGNPFVLNTPPTTPGAHTYFVRWESSCGNSTCAQTTVTVNATPAAPTSLAATPASLLCGPGTVALSASVNPTDALEWFTDGACSGAPVANPASVSLSSTTLFYARSRSTANCASACVGPLTVTVANDTTGPTINTCAGNQSVNADANCQAVVPDFTAGVSATDACSAVTVSQSPSAGTTVTGAGAHTIVLTATDAASNSSTCNATLTVVDVTPPNIVTCAPGQSADADADCLIALPDFTGDVIASDNCGVVTITQSPAPGTLVGAGVTNVTLTATDGAMLTAVCGTTFTVTDVTPPSAGGTCPANIVVNADAGSSNATNVSWTPPTWTDNCTSPVTDVTPSHSPPATFPIGVTSVTYTAKDAAMNATVCSFTVTVNDAEAPSFGATCPATITVNADLDACDTMVSWTPPTATDNNGTPTVTQVQGLAPGSPFAVGTTHIRYRAVDAANNTAFCDFDVIVIDNQDPVIADCPSNISVGNDPGDCTAIVSWDDPTVTDNCPGASISQTAGPVSGQAFPVGMTTITYTATDASNRTATCSFAVTVTDGEPPSITDCGPARSANASPCQALVPNFTATVMAEDNCTPSGSLIISQSPPAGTPVGVGVTTVVITVRDAANNSATCPNTFTVHYIDTDNDGVPDCVDNCPTVANPSQSDCDGDLIGDACDDPCPVDCVVGPWSDWSDCTVTCGGGIQTRTRSIVIPSANGGAACPPLVQTRSCNTQPCPVDCVLSDWSPWSACTATCGGGIQTRTRTILVPPANGGAPCGPLVQTQSCNTQPCPVDCVLSDWSPWSACTVTCGGGVQTRTRTVLVPPAFGGAPCGPLVETQPCNTQPCPVDCVLSDWSPWSACTVTCGGGVQTRTRTVLVPPAFGGAPCGPLVETQPCNTQPCLVGACCNAGTCTPNVLQTDCENSGGVFQGASSLCPNLHVTVELSPTVSASVQRCISFDLYACPGTTPVSSFDRVVAFTGGIGSFDLPLPCGTYTCMVARDRRHTLASTVQLGTTGPGQYTADFTGRRNDEPGGGTGGHRLVGGNLNGDPFIDVLDFGAWAGQYLQNYGTGDTTCTTPSVHADLSGDGLVDSGDFSFIAINFLMVSENSCCPGDALMAGPNGTARRLGPVTRISTMELRNLGMGNLAAGDVNRDGMLDLIDVSAVMMGQLPTPVNESGSDDRGVLTPKPMDPVGKVGGTGQIRAVPR